MRCIEMIPIEVLSISAFRLTLTWDVLKCAGLDNNSIDCTD